MQRALANLSWGDRFMRETVKRSLKVVGYGLLTLLLTLYFMFLTFPFSSIQEPLLSQMTKGLPLSIEMGEVEATPLLWMRFTDVRIQLRSETPLMKIDDIRIRPSLLALFLGKVSFRFKASLYGGTAKGSIGSGGETREISLSWKDLLLGEYGSIPVMKDAKVDGALSGKVQLKVQGGNWILSQGSVSGLLAQGGVKNFSLYGFPIPNLQDLTGKIEIRIEQKKALLERFSLEGDSLQFSAEGNADLLPRFSSSRLDLKGRMKLAGELASQYQPLLAGFLRSQDSEGFSTFSLKGTLGNPRFAP